MDLIDNKMCFACGKDNAIGLHLDFTFDEIKKTSAAFFVPKPEHQGYADIIHGGILALVMDESMVKLAFELGLQAVSVNLTVNLHKPVKVGERLTVQGTIVEEQGRKVKAKSEIINDKQEVVCDATALLIKLKE